MKTSRAALTCQLAVVSGQLKLRMTHTMLIVKVAWKRVIVNITLPYGARVLLP